MFILYYMQVKNARKKQIFIFFYGPKALAIKLKPKSAANVLIKGKLGNAKSTSFYLSLY